MRKVITAAAVLGLVILWSASPGAKAAEQLSIEAIYGNFQASGIAHTDASDYLSLTSSDFPADKTRRLSPVRSRNRA